MEQTAMTDNIPELLEQTEREIGRLSVSISAIAEIADGVSGALPTDDAPAVSGRGGPCNIAGCLQDILSALRYQNSRIETQGSRLESALTPTATEAKAEG